MNWKLWAGLCAVCFIGGAYALPRPEPVVVTEVQTVVQEHTVTKTKVVERPNGTKVTTVTETRTATATEDAKATVAATSQKQWHLNALVGKDTNGITQYGAALERRIVGSVFVGVWVLGSPQQQAAGLSLGVQF